jgi:hypothetical protein
MASFPVAIQVLGVGDHYVLAEQIESFIQGFPHPSHIAFMEKIGAIHDDFQMRRSKFIEQSAGFSGRINHVCQFWFDTECDLIFFGDLQSLLHRC